jgi:hypothetical protein
MKKLATAVRTMFANPPARQSVDIEAARSELKQAMAAKKDAEAALSVALERQRRAESSAAAVAARHFVRQLALLKLRCQPSRNL